MTANGRKKACERCGARFVCSVDGRCWCMDEPYRLPMPKPGESVFSDCLCRDCLRVVAEAAGAARV